MHTTLTSQINQIDTHVQLLSDSIVRLEDFKDALYKNTDNYHTKGAVKLYLKKSDAG